MSKTAAGSTTLERAPAVAPPAVLEAPRLPEPAGRLRGVVTRRMAVGLLAIATLGALATLGLVGAVRRTRPRAPA